MIRTIRLILGLPFASLGVLLLFISYYVMGQDDYEEFIGKD